MTLRMSCNAAPVLLVTTPMHLGYAGSGFLCSAAKSPSCSSLAFSCSKAKADADASKKLEDAKKMIDLEREKALNDLRASVTGLAMTATAKLLSEQAGPESDKKRYQAFLASAGEKHD